MLTCCPLHLHADRPNVAGLVLAGSADFKTELGTSDLFDLRLKAVVICTVDVSYGGENGFNQAIDLSSDTLGNVKFVQVRPTPAAAPAERLDIATRGQSNLLYFCFPQCGLGTWPREPRERCVRRML